MVLILVLVVIALLTLAALTFSELMLTEREGVDLAARQTQAMAAAESGVEMARLFMSLEKETQDDAGGWYDNPNRFQKRLVVGNASAKRRARFSVVAPALQDQGYRSGIRFGLEDESTRLNLNTVLVADEKVENGARQILMGLPGMTEDVADAILDWIDSDNEPREYGAEADYYAFLDPPYTPKNGPLETIEELLLVRGVTPWLLFGSDANRNGVIDRDEPSADMIEGVDNVEGAMDSGWSSYLTLYSLELNLRPDGQARVDVNQEDLEELYDELEGAVGRQWATFIVAYRQSGPYTGTEAGALGATGQLDLSKTGRVKLDTVLDLIGPRVKVKFKGDDEDTILETPFPELPGVMNAYLPIMMDYLTVNPSPIIPGRINLNQATRTVLAGIPGMTDEVLEEVLSRRQKDPVDRLPARRHETWILGEGIVTLEEMKGLIPFVCGGGCVFRAQWIGYFDEEGPSVRVEAILDATARPARVLFWRDMSHLGRGYPLETLGIELDY